MRGPQLLPAVAGLALLALTACSGSNKKTSPSLPTVAPSFPARSAQTPRGAGIATPPVAQRFVTPAPSPAQVTDLTDMIRLRAGDLPQGFGLGQFQAYQPNEAAVNGYENPQDVLSRMNATGRLGGLVQQITSPDSQGGLGVTIDVWKDAAGAKTFFDQYPRPDPSITYKEITLPQPPGEQVFAIQASTNGQTAYSVSWRRGRLILGVGEIFPAGKESLDKLQPIIDLVDRKAQAAAQ